MYNSARERDYKGFYDGSAQMGKQIWEHGEITKRNSRNQERDRTAKARIREIGASWVTIQQHVSFCFAFYLFI